MGKITNKQESHGLNTAQFRFYEELNDFLPKSNRKKTFTYRFWGHPAIKDAIEAVGVPHTAIDLIVINGQSVDFTHPLKNGDRVSIYPVFETLDISPIVRLRSKPLRKTRFILDVQLGKLARLLRMLGFDSLYRSDYCDRDIIKIAQEQHRIILTRHIGLLKNKSVTHGYWVRATSPEAQLDEVIHSFDLSSQIKPFERCMVCNSSIEKVGKKMIQPYLFPRTKAYFDEFYRCRGCGKIYWKGSHYERMKKKFGRWIK